MRPLYWKLSHMTVTDANNIHIHLFTLLLFTLYIQITSSAARNIFWKGVPVKTARMLWIILILRHLCNSLLDTFIIQGVLSVLIVTGHQAKLMSHILSSAWTSQKYFVYSAAAWNLFLWVDDLCYSDTLQLLGKQHVFINHTDTGINRKCLQQNIVQE